MAERLTTKLREGSVERLRTLAGGERKVGEFLSDIVTLLWQQREILREITKRQTCLKERIAEHYRFPKRRYIGIGTDMLPIVDIRERSLVGLGIESDYHVIIASATADLHKLSDELIELQYKMDVLLTERFQDVNERSR